MSYSTIIETDDVKEQQEENEITFSLFDYMSGKELPEPKWKSKQNKEPSTIYYGLYLSSQRNKPSKFSSYKREFVDKLPNIQIVFTKEGRGKQFVEEINAELDVLLIDFKKEISPKNECQAEKKIEKRVEEQEPIKLSFVGRIVSHNDSFKTHFAICLKIVGDDAYLLFITSNPKWNNFSRLITQDEHFLCNFKRKPIRETFLAPVIRPVREIFLMNGVFPESRIDELLREFFNSPEQIDKISRY